MKIDTLTLCVFTLVVQPILAQDTDEIVWEADWDTEILIDLEDYIEPFKEPGVILPGYSFEGTMHTLGLAWQANSLQEVAGLVCINLGPLIYSLTGIEDVKEECNHILFSLKNGLASDINSKCLDVWDELVMGYNENSTLFEITECYTTINHEESPGALQSAAEVMAGVYSSCEGYGLGTDRLSAIAVSVLDWLGPPVLSLVTQLDPYAAPYMGCNILRYILSMQIDDIDKKITELATYPVADALEYLRDLQICDKLENNEDHSEGFNFILDTLQALSRMSQSSLCSFFEGSLTRSDFNSTALTIINSANSIIKDTAICRDVITALAKTEAATYLYNVTGRDVTTSTNIDSLCDDIVEAVADGASTDPAKYSLPDNVNISEYEFLSNPGELLPEFFFNDTLAFAGAVLSADTVAQAVVKYCNVFHEFLVDNGIFDELGVDVDEICSSLRNNDLEGIELICLSHLAAPVPYNGYPLSLKKIDPRAVAANTGRKLLGAESFSNVIVCKALDKTFHSSNNLRSIASFALSDYIREALPIADSICENYEEIICYFDVYCYDGQPASDLSYGLENFDEIAEDVEALLLKALGYSTRTSLCNDISDGVDVLSGRAKEATVEEMVSKILSILDDTSLCTELIDEAITMISDEMDAEGVGDMSQQIMYQVTGLNDTTEICQIVAENFPSYAIPSSESSFSFTMLGLLLSLLWTTY